DPLRVPVRLEPAGAYALGGAVRALRASDGVRLSNGGTEDGGERLFCDVPAEPFRVEVRAGGYAPGLSDVVDPTRLPDAVEVRLEPLGVVHGVVTHDGAPVAGAEVLAHDGATEAAGGDPFATRPAGRLAAAQLDGK